MASPAATRSGPGQRGAAGQPGQDHAGPGGHPDRPRQPAPLDQRLGGRAEPAQRRPGQRARGGHQRQQAEEHPAPAGAGRDQRRQGRPDQAGHDPGGREDGEHPRPQCLRVAAADGGVGDRRDRPRPQPLEAAGQHQDQHAGGEAADGQAGHEHQHAGHERRARAAPVGLAAGDHDPDQQAELEGAGHPAVQADALEVVLDRGQDRDDGQGLEGDQGDGQDQPDGEPAPGRRHQPGRPPRRPLHCWPTRSCYRRPTGRPAGLTGNQRVWKGTPVVGHPPNPPLGQRHGSGARDPRVRELPLW